MGIACKYFCSRRDESYALLEFGFLAGRTKTNFLTGISGF